jgi:short-subunit dehydrogenase
LPSKVVVAQKRDTREADFLVQSLYLIQREKHKMSQRFQDKTVIITGASAGIGAACARQFLAEGANVVLTARGKDALEATTRELGNARRTLAIAADASDAEAMKSVLQKASDTFSAVHILVNNAGFNARGAVEETPADSLARIVDVNLKAPIVLCQHALPFLRRAGGGAIVNVASIAGMVPLAHEATYSATKFGLRAFSFALAEELRGSPISVSVVSPGPVSTEFLLHDLHEAPDIVFSQPMSTAAEIAALVLDCAADGKAERARPVFGAMMATVAYLFPSVRRVLKPIMESIGRRAKARYQAQRV